MEGYIQVNQKGKEKIGDKTIWNFCMAEIMQTKKEDSRACDDRMADAINGVLPRETFPEPKV